MTKTLLVLKTPAIFFQKLTTEYKSAFHLRDDGDALRLLDEIEGYPPVLGDQFGINKPSDNHRQSKYNDSAVTSKSKNQEVTKRLQLWQSGTQPIA